VKTVPLFGNEVLGLDALRCMATAAFGTDDPTNRFSEGAAPTNKQTSPHSYRLTVPVPFATRGDIRVSHSGDELLIQVGSYRHRQVLPRTLVGLNPHGAKLDEASHLLTVRFERIADGVSGGNTRSECCRRFRRHSGRRPE